MTSKSEITPVLRGSCPMQGPVDETNCKIKSNTEFSRDEKGSGWCSESKKVLMRVQSGTCNVCSAPCSSCLHGNRALMGLKTDEYSDETCQGNAGSQYSVNDVVPVKSNACDSRQPIDSETSNVLSFNSNHDCLSENAESKVSTRSYDVSGQIEDVGTHPNLSAGGTTVDDQLPLKPQFSSDHIALRNKFDDGNGIQSSTYIKEAASDTVHKQRSASYIRGGADDGSLTGDNSLASDRVCLILEAETEKNPRGINLVTEAGNISAQIEAIKNVKESCVSPDVQEASLQSPLVDDNNASEVLEHDVEVCDICGDAGREDLLAICCRCGEGAEHTYCMREMMDKVPEGDWLCEECKFDDEIKNLGQDKIVTLDGNGRNQPSGLESALDTNLFVKLDKKDSDLESNKMTKDVLSTKASSKRHAESFEVASAVKRQALEPTVESPKTSSPGRLAAVSRDSSFRNLNKGKVKLEHQLSCGTSSTNDTSEASFSSMGRQLQTPRGTLLKSNSFHSTNAKPKVERVDEVISQKQKSAREPASLDMKEGAARLIGKSMSFKSVYPGRLNHSESKVKMLSPKFSHSQDLKGLRQAKERNLIERKNSFKSERSLASSAMGDTAVSNNCEPKGVRTDGKISSLSKSTSHVPRRDSEMPVAPGENKRLSCLPSSSGASSTNGVSSSVDRKQNQSNIMDGSFSSTNTYERPFCNGNGLLDVASRSHESTNLGERIRESSVDCSRPSISTGGRSAPCQKCKEIGHSAQFCTVDTPLSLPADASAARISREVEGNKLKAAIEAAMLKKPVCRKSVNVEQSDELSVSSTDLNRELRSQSQLSTSFKTRNMLSADVADVHEGQAVVRNSTANSCTQTTVNGMKQVSTLASEAAAVKTGDISLIALSEGKPHVRDLPSHASAAMSVLLKMSAIPEHECIWQGGFQVYNSREVPELHDGIQAHISTCASPNVLEVANKFPSKILLNEVPRLSTWPVQFKETGANEDNIALYFFAKDLESYEKSYKRLMDTMMKSDLALKGNFDGVELLIFPSNHLPEKSQRWNMLYFLWGVFRGRKVNCLQNASGSAKKDALLQDMPMTIMSSPENCGGIDGASSTRSNACKVAMVSECPASIESPCLSSEIINGNCDTKASSLDRKQANVWGQDCRLDDTSLSMGRTNSQSFQETRCTSTFLGDNVDWECKLDVKLQPSVQAAGNICGSNSIEQTVLCPGNPPDIQPSSSLSFEIPAGVKNDEDQATCERTLKEEEGCLDAKAVLEREEARRVQTIKELNNHKFIHGKRLHEDPTWTVSQTSASQTSWNDAHSVLVDGVCASKKQKTGFIGLFGDASSSRVTFASRIDDLGTTTPTKERVEVCCDERDTLKNYGTSERYFFPVEPHPVKDISSREYSVPWKVFSSEEEDRLPGVAPSLELALGAEMKPSKQEILPFLVGKVDLNECHVQPAENIAAKEEEEVSASLSLSLSFPFPD